MFKYKILIFFTVIGLASSLTLFFIINNSEYNRISTEFKKTSTERIDLILYTFGMGELVTESLSNLFLASEKVLRSEFENFAHSYLKKIDGLKSVMWIPRIAYSQKDKYLDDLKNDDEADVLLFELDKYGNKIPVKKRETYYPIIYKEPYEKYLDKIGYDLGSDRRISNVLLKASLTGQSIASARSELIDNNDTSYCISIIDPVFKVPQNKESRVKDEIELLGFTSCKLSIKEIVESSFDIVKTEGIDILLYDVSDTTKKELLHSSREGPQKEYKYDSDALSYSYNFNIGERNYSITCFATDKFISEQKSLLPFLTLITGLLLTIILVRYNLKIFKERDEISIKVKTRTAELKESNQRLDLALNAAELVVWDWDIKAGQVYLSDKMYKILGYDENEGISNADLWRGLIHPDDSAMVQNKLDKHFKNETPIYSVEYRVKTKSGDYKWILDMGKVFERNKYEKPLRAIGILMDISDRKSIQYKMLEYSKMLEKDNSDMNRLFSIIGHDLKSPLISIKGFAEFLYKEIKDLSEEEIAEYSKYIFQASNSLHSILEGLLDWGQMQLGKIVFNPEHANLYQLTDIIINQLLIMAAPKKITIENKINVEMSVYADKTMISTVLRNLLSNSIKFTLAEGKVIINAENAGNNEIIISVQDTGVGIEPDQLENILTESFNKSTLGTDGEKGTGLGLSLSRDFIERNGGRMWVESELGIGTTFYFTIPAKKQSNKA